jgi:hypothetical protein
MRHLPAGAVPLLFLLAAPVAARAVGDEPGGDGHWFDLATGGEGAAPSAAAPAEDSLDPDALSELADRTGGIAAQLASLQTDDAVRGNQREVEQRLTNLIGILEREGG